MKILLLTFLAIAPLTSSAIEKDLSSTAYKSEHMICQSLSTGKTFTVYANRCPSGSKRVG